MDTHNAAVAAVGHGYGMVKVFNEDAVNELVDIILSAGRKAAAIVDPEDEGFLLVWS